MKPFPFAIYPAGIKKSKPTFSPSDYTNDFNTDLSQEEESEFQEFAAKNNLLKDLPDYDVRGAWKAIQGGTDPRGYGGFWNDRFKKPNHPLFSTESIYHGKTNEKTGEIYEGGIWEKIEPETESNPYGKYRWTPSHWNLSVYPKEHAEEYWNRVEAGNGHEIRIGANRDEHEGFIQQAKASPKKTGQKI